jgi:hypothetical protein
VTLACGVRYVVIALANFVIKQEMDTQASKQRYRTVPQRKLRYQCVILDCQTISVSNFLDVPLHPRFLVLETISQGGTDLYKFGLDFTRGVEQYIKCPK